MSSKQYKDFDAITTIASSDLFLIAQASDDVNKKITYANLLAKLKTDYTIAPIGTTYIQYYGMSDPATLFGGTWSKKYDSEAVFFRTEGSASTTYEERAFDNNVQDSQMQGHYHGTVATYYGGTPGTGANPYVTNSTLAAGAVTIGAATTDGTNGTPRTGLETRPRNRVIRIWKRTA